MSPRQETKFIIIRLDIARKQYFMMWCLFIVFVWSVSSLLPFELSYALEKLSDDKKRQRVYEMYADYRKSFPEVKEISPLEAMTLMKTGKVVFVDTRKRKEQKISVLPGAITEKAFRKKLKQYKDYTVIGYCTISYRSGKLAKKLGKKGIKMWNLKGGILAWIHEGGKVYNKHGETKRVHVYSKKWNYAPKRFEAVW